MEEQKNNFGSTMNLEVANKLLQEKLSKGSFEDISLMDDKEKMEFAKAIEELDREENIQTNVDTINSFIAEWGLDNIK